MRDAKNWILQAGLLLLLVFPIWAKAQSGAGGPISNCNAQKSGDMDPRMARQIHDYIARKHLTTARGQMGSVTTVPVVWFIIENRGTTSPISAARVHSQMDVMNQAFSPWGIRFSIAKNFPNGSPLTPIPLTPNVTAIDQFDPANPGIFWVNSAVYNAVWGGFGTTTHTNMVNAITNLSDDDYLFLFVHPLDQGGPLYGQSNVGVGPNTSIGDGAAVRPEAFGDINHCGNCVCFHDRGYTMLHEIGHYLGLFHVDEGSSCANGGTPTDCYYLGDFVCDIGYQPMRDQNFDCVTLPPIPVGAPCTGYSYVSGNFMDYMADKFQTSFTAGQADYMDAWLHLMRSQMIDPEHVQKVGCRGDLFFVNAATGSPSNSGLSWGSALSDLNDALAMSSFGDEIWVAQGQYSTPGLVPTESFDIPDGVAVYGGFNGTETTRNMRTLQPSNTVLSGAGFNYHVVTSSGSRFTVLDGFTISGGKANGGGSHESEGAGVFLDHSNISIDNCVITENESVNDGAALYCLGGNPTFHRTHVVTNYSTNGSPAMAFRQNANALVVDCNFRYNESLVGYGGGLSCIQSDLKLVNSIICYNEAPKFGSAVHNQDGTVEIINCTIFGNANSALFTQNGTLKVTNTIIFEHKADLEKQGNPIVSFRYSSYQFATTFPAPTNHIGNPHVVNDPNLGFPLEASSSCIDAGFNAAITPFAEYEYYQGVENERVFDAANCQALDILDPTNTPNVVVDMGAREFRNNCPRIGHVQEVEPNSALLQLKVAPNPSKGNFDLWLPDGQVGSLTIYDGKGALVFARDQIHGAKVPIDLTGMSKGLYKAIFRSKAGVSVVNIALQ